MQLQKEKAKNFKRQVIKYMECLLQSQQQVSISGPNTSNPPHVVLQLKTPVLCLPPADQILGGFLT